jgi:hypothetical protein
MLNHPKVVRFKEVMLTPTKLAVISEVRQLPASGTVALAAALATACTHLSVVCGWSTRPTSPSPHWPTSLTGLTGSLTLSSVSQAARATH